MNTGLKVVLILLLVFVGLPVLGTIIFAIYGVAKYGDAKPADTQKAATDPCEESSFGYLYSLQNATGIASAYWKPKVTPMGMIDVHSFVVVAHGNLLSNGKPFKVPRVYYRYEVESSNAAGIPIRKRWDIAMEPGSKNVLDKSCAIVEVREAQ